ncbi:MAG: L,D-transpeptidase [Gemmatimonadaceae bacterium]
MHQTRLSMRAVICSLATLLALSLPASAQAPEKTKSVGFSAASSPLVKFPFRIPATGPATLHLQILLDRAHFSPGILDGEWGQNAATALAFFANPETAGRLTGATPKRPTSIDKATYDRLRDRAGKRPLLKRYRLRPADVAGPFTPIPSDVYEQAKLKCLCYASTAEAIAEQFHTSPKLLGQLNPHVNIEKMRAGTELLIPDVADENVSSSMDTVIVAKLIISKTGFWTHAVGSDGMILAHFPSTLGAGYDPSPTGAFSVTYVSRDPGFHYQPKLFAEVPNSRPEARLPPGPNSPVGRVWMSLSKPHYGIHGTSSPETIGYASSHGCVRLTNWDALQLSDLVESGTPVEFH